MPIELITSKLFVPPLRSGLVPRPRLIQVMNEGLDTKRKLTLVSAPAGFGKTTLVTTWLSQVGIQVAWLSLEEADNDLPRFLTYLAAAFQQIDEAIGAPLRDVLQAPQLPAIEKILTGLLNEISIQEDAIILVLDDYHLLTDTAVLEVMDFLIDHQPPQLYLVLTTREDPELPLSRLRARDQITEIRARDLRFTQGEAEIFLRDVMGLAISDQDVAALEDRTEGWAVGLQLAGLSMQNQADLTRFIANFSGSHRHILDYLTDEVVRQQPEDIRKFLLQSAILDRLSGPLCDALTGRNDSDMVLKRLDTANLFVIPLDDDRRWYRYHHLFADLLRSQLTRSHSEQIPELHRRASLWYEEHGDIQAAVEHALQDSDPGHAGRLIEQHAFPMLYQGQVAVLLGWFDKLPEQLLHKGPFLCIAKAWALALMQRGSRTGEVDMALQDAHRALDQVNAGQALRELVAGHAASIQAFLLQTPARLGEKPEKLIALTREAQQLLPAHEKAIRSVNFLNIGYANLVLVDLKAAEIAYQQSLEEGLAGGNLYAAIYGPTNMAVIALLKGRLQEALYLCETYIEKFNRILAGQNFPPIGALEILKGSVLLEFNRLAEAEPALLQGLDFIRLTGEYEAPITGYPALARLYAIQGDRSAMTEAFKALDETWPDGAFYTMGLRHRLLIRHWPDDPDVQNDAQAWLDQSGIVFEKLAVIHSVDPLSTVYFEKHLSAAYILAHLAIEKARLYPLDAVHDFLRRQAEFAETHGIAGWVVAVAIARTLLYQAVDKKDQALKTLASAISAGARTELYRIFLDECTPLQALLEDLLPQLSDEVMINFASHLLEAMHCQPAKAETLDRSETQLSERELEVLRCLAGGLTYEEVGRQLFLSLNTVQFHVKNIYGKLMVNKRVQAIEKARELKLI